MDQGSNDIRQDIESTRAALDDKVTALQDKARDTVQNVQSQASSLFDVNYQASERPWAVVGAGVAVGFLLGSLGGGKKDEYRYQPSSDFTYRPSKEDQRRYMPNYSQTQSDPNNQYRYYPSSGASYNQSSQSYNQGSGSSNQGGAGGFLSQFDEEIDSLKVAAIGAVRDLLRSTVREYVPAMSQQLDRIEQQRGTSSSPSSSSEPYIDSSTRYTPGSSPNFGSGSSTGGSAQTPASNSLNTPTT